MRDGKMKLCLLLFLTSWLIAACGSSDRRIPLGPQSLDETAFRARVRELAQSRNDTTLCEFLGDRRGVEMYDRLVAALAENFGPIPTASAAQSDIARGGDIIREDCDRVLKKP